MSTSPFHPSNMDKYLICESCDEYVFVFRGDMLTEKQLEDTLEMAKADHLLEKEDW